MLSQLLVCLPEPQECPQAHAHTVHTAVQLLKFESPRLHGAMLGASAS